MVNTQAAPCAWPAMLSVVGSLRLACETPRRRKSLAWIVRRTARRLLLKAVVFITKGASNAEASCDVGCDGARRVGRELWWRRVGERWRVGQVGRLRDDGFV